MSRFQYAPEFLADWQWAVDPSKPTWAVLARRAAKLTARLSTSGAFKDHFGRAKSILSDFDFSTYREALQTRGMVRAFVHVWLSDPDLARATLRGRALNALSDAPGGLSRMTTSALIQLHLNYFDEVDSWEPTLFATVRSAVLRAVSGQAKSRGFQDLVESVRNNPTLLIDQEAPDNLARLVVEENHTLSGLLADFRLEDIDARRYRHLAQQRVYLQRIQKADPTQSHDFLKELPTDEIRKAYRPGGGYFGLTLIEALTERDKVSPSSEWLNTILDIAGDPRMSFTNEWRTWWQPLSDHARETMVRWLSDQDLELFLRTIAEYGEKSGNTAQNRMYPDREEFLRGLQRAGLVRETRLYMPESVRSFAAMTLPPAQMKTVTLLNGTPDQSVIFIDCGEFHIIEGSHSFKLWIYKGTPAEELTRRTNLSADIRDFRTYLPAKYGAKNQRFEGISHLGIWQYPALEFLIRELGIDLDPANMMTRKSYLEMRAKKGLP